MNKNLQSEAAKPKPKEFTIEHASTAGAKCRSIFIYIYLACKEKIKKGTIRVGRMEVAEDGYSKGKCIF